jgi:hypothetical protein
VQSVLLLLLVLPLPAGEDGGPQVLQGMLLQGMLLQGMLLLQTRPWLDSQATREPLQGH